MSIFPITRLDKSHFGRSVMKNVCFSVTERIRLKSFSFTKNFLSFSTIPGYWIVDNDRKRGGQEPTI